MCNTAKGYHQARYLRVWRKKKKPQKLQVASIGVEPEMISL